MGGKIKSFISVFLSSPNFPFLKKILTKIKSSFCLQEKKSVRHLQFSQLAAALLGG